MEEDAKASQGGWSLWLPTLALTLLFLAEGVGKLLALDPMVAAWERWGHPMWLMFLVGGVETIAAIALLSRRSAFYAGIALLALMPGAVYTHLRAGEWHLLPLPLVASALLLVVLWKRAPTSVRARLAARSERVERS